MRPVIVMLNPERRIKITIRAVNDVGVSAGMIRAVGAFAALNPTRVSHVFYEVTSRARVPPKVVPSP